MGEALNANAQATIDSLQQTANVANLVTYSAYSNVIVQGLDNATSFSNYEKKFVFRANNYIKQYLVS